MKHRLQTLLKHKLQWLVLLTALLGMSQGVWGWDNCRIYGQFGTNKTYTTSSNIACSGSVPYDLTPGDYQFCIQTNENKWLTVGTQTISESISGWLYYYSNNSDEKTTLHVTVAGTYTFTCTECRNDGIKISVTFPGSSASFTEGQLLWLDLRGNSYGSTNGEKIYASFYYSSSWHRQQMTLVAKGNGTYTEKGLYVYRVTSSDAGNNPSKMRFERGPSNGESSWNNSNELSASDLSSYNGMLIDVGSGTSWDNVGTKYAFSPTNVVVSTPSLTMKNSDGSSTITECMAGETVRFVESGKSITVTLNNSAKQRDLYSPRYRYTFVNSDNYQSGWLSTDPPQSWNTGDENVASGNAKVEITFPVDGSGTLASSIDNGYLKSQTTSFTVNAACSKPAASFTTVKAQLNAGGGSPWAGSEATTSTAASDGYFADEHRTITLTETNGSYAYYQWEVSTDNGSNYSDISGASTASSSYTAPLPGTYKFRCKAGCSSSDYSTSGAITVNVPYPSMGIEGPGIKGCAAWTPSYASGSGIMTRSGLTWSGTVTVNATGTTDGAFIIIQQYKNGATSGTGWASCTEDGNACSGTCDSDNIKGNTVNKDCKRNTLTNLDKVDGGNYYFNSNKFAADQQVKITVTMTAYNTYTVTACLVPQSLSITGPLQACVNDESLTAMVASVTATSPSYQWQESSDASSWADVSTGSGDKTASYTPAKSVSAKYYRCAVTACGVTENSTHKLYTIYGTSVAGSIAQKTSGATSPLGICKNATATLVLSGNTGSIQWQKYNSSTSKFEDKSGETGSEYTTTAKNATGTDYYRAAVTNGTCATAYTATTTAGAFQVVSYNPVDAGTVALTPNEVCVGEDSQASVTGVELAGGVGDWSAGSGASIDSDGSIETSSSGTPSITYTISSYKCAGTASANATLTVKATPSFSITPASPSGTAWKPVTLSTSPTQTGAVWSITTNHSEAGDATSVGYLSATSGSGTVFKGPAPASSGSNTFVVQATVTDGSSGCSKSVTKNVAVSYEDCE